MFKSVAPPSTFVWLTGHARNVGDSVLRRPFVESVRAAGPVKVWAGVPNKDNAGYIEGLQLHPGELAPGFVRWYFSFLVEVVRGRANFAFNPGEFGVTKAYLAGLVPMFPVLLLLKLKGGRIIWVGASVSRRRDGWMGLFDWLARHSDLLIWRDVRSPRLMGAGETMPDLAFVLGEETRSKATLSEIPRNVLAVVLRGDRDYPSAEWITAVQNLADRQKLQVVLMVQVSDDRQSSQRLAEAFGAQLIDWDSSSHVDQEVLLRRWYRRSSIVLSDRLHALIIAATEGAIPLGWCESATEKISVHMDAVGALWASAEKGESVEKLDSLSAAGVEELASALSLVIERAHGDVDRVLDRVSAVLTGGVVVGDGTQVGSGRVLGQ